MSSHDLDNILLENLGDTRTLQAVFDLEALVLTGKIVHSYLRELKLSSPIAECWMRYKLPFL